MAGGREARGPSDHRRGVRKSALLISAGKIEILVWRLPGSRGINQAKGIGERPTGVRTLSICMTVTTTSRERIISTIKFPTRECQKFIMAEPVTLENQDEALADTIRAFITPNRQSRYLDLLPLARRARLRFDKMLEHRFSEEMDLHYATAISPDVDEVEASLRSAGAPPNCLVASQCDLDGQILPLRDALQEIVGSRIGSLIVCLPGRLAYHEGEGLGAHFILTKRSGQK